MSKIKQGLLLIFIALGMVKTVKAQDWANLNQFKKENAKLNTPDKENRVVFMGNSITIGWLNARPEFFKNKPYINRGISGQTTPQMLLRFRQDVIALQPKVVVILAGVNDIAGNTGPSTLEMITDNIKSMAELADAHNIKVVLSSVLPAHKIHWKPEIKSANKVIQLNTLIKAYAQEKNHIYLDYFSAMVDHQNGLPKKYATDGIHPTKEGYMVMEPLVEIAIEEALSKFITNAEQIQK